MIMRKLLPVLILFCVAFLSSCEKDKPESSEKKILTFRFESVDPEIGGVIDEAARTITLTDVPYASVSAIAPVITLSDGATVSPESGVEQDFTSPVTYTVTAEDGTTQAYVVTVIPGIEELSGTMSANRTLEDRFDGDAIDYIIDGTFYVDGNALLTVEAGVKIAFTGVDGWIVVGENAGLKMTGTEQKPIILTGPVNNNNKGAWGGVEYNSNRADNQLEYVSIINAGSNNYYAALTINSDAGVNIKNSRIENSATFGLDVIGTLNGFMNNVITGCNQEPVKISYIDEAVKLDAASQLTGNAKDHVSTSGFRDIQSADITLNKLTVPWFIENGIYFDRKLTVTPGTTILFNNDTFFEIEPTGTIVARGSVAEPIVFRHVDNTKGGWQGIFIESYLQNSISNCIIKDGGSYDGYRSNIYLDYNASLTISDTQLNNSIGYGIILYTDSNIIATNVTFSDNQLGNIRNEDEETVSSAF